MAIICVADASRQQLLDRDQVLARIEMIDRDYANRPRRRLVEHKAIVTFADRYCVSESHMNGVVAIADGDHAFAAGVHRVIVAVAESYRVINTCVYRVGAVASNKHAVWRKKQRIVAISGVDVVSKVTGATGNIVHRNVAIAKNCCVVVLIGRANDVKGDVSVAVSCRVICVANSTVIYSLVSVAVNCRVICVVVSAVIRVISVAENCRIICVVFSAANRVISVAETEGNICVVVSCVMRVISVAETDGAIVVIGSPVERVISIAEAYKKFVLSSPALKTSVPLPTIRTAPVVLPPSIM